jgi:predicted ATPase
MRSLDRIQLTGFKSIREMDLTLGSLNILIGANGVGKTNFVSLFRLLNQIAEGNLQVFIAKSGGANTLLHFGQKVTNEIVIELGFGNDSYNCTLIPAASDTLIFAQESCLGMRQQWSRPFKVDLGKGHKESQLETSVRKTPIAKNVLDSLRNWQVYHFHDTSESAGIKQTGDINDNDTLRSDASNLAAFLYLHREAHPEHYSLIVDTIRLAAPFFDDFMLRPSPANSTKIRLEWHERDSDAYFDASSLSDGTLRFACLATLLLQPTLPSTILIDEPELGLHPYAITLLASMLHSAATKTQVIVSTQSVTLVNQFSPQDIIIVDREDGQSKFKRLNTRRLKRWLEEYGLGELWEKNILGGRPRR